MSKPFENRPIGRKSALLALAVSVIRGGNQVALKFALVAFAPFGRLWEEWRSARLESGVGRGFAGFPCSRGPTNGTR